MDGENWYVYCGNDPVNMVDPTGMWFGFTHREITEKAYNKIVPKKKRKAKEKGYLKSLKEGCTLPDEKRGEARRKEKETKYENHRYHGQKDYYKVMVEQIKKAKSKNTNKYKQIGIGLHALQDFYAHNVKLNGKIVKAKM